MILCWNNICIYLLQKQVIVSTKHSPFSSYGLVSFCYSSLTPGVFDIKEVYSSKQVLSFIPEQDGGKPQKSCKARWQKVYAKKFNQTWYVPSQLNIFICNLLGRDKYYSWRSDLIMMKGLLTRLVFMLYLFDTYMAYVNSIWFCGSKEFIRQSLSYG